MLIVPIIVICLYSEILFDCIIEDCFEVYAFRKLSSKHIYIIEYLRTKLMII